MSSAIDLTGRWVGHYVQGGQEYPILADLVQAGPRLSGSMHDGHPDRECSTFEAAVEAGLPPGADEQIEARLRDLVPDAPAGPIRYVSHLPPVSVLEGRCDGSTVSFRKTYQGTSFGGYKVGDKLIGMKRDGHTVHYEGRLGSDGREIAGQWWIDADSAAGTRRTEGAFVLRRAPSAESPAAAPAAEEVKRPWWKRWSSP